MNPSSKSPDFPRIANIYGSGVSSQATDSELKLIARYDLLIGGLKHPNTSDDVSLLNSNMNRLREINPSIVVLDFAASAPYFTSPDRLPAGTPPSPNDIWLRTTEGDMIHGWPGTHMLNLGNERAVEFLAQHILKRIDGLLLDGVFVDCMMGEFDQWAVEIRTGKKVKIDADGDGVEDDPAALDAAWVAGKALLLSKLRAALGKETIIMVNGQTPAEFMRPLINGNFLEDYVDYTLVGSHGRSWQSVVDQYLSWCNTPHEPNCTTINATSVYWPEYEAWDNLDYAENGRILQHGYSQLQKMRFGLTTALIGDGYYGFDLNTRWPMQHWWYAEYDAPLGTALGSAQANADGTWQRDFAGGRVIVNPTPREVHIKFASKHRDFTTSWSGKEMLLPSYDGRIYVPVG